MTAVPDFREDKPFPLAHAFRRRILPGFALFVAALLAITIFAAHHVTESIYLEQAQRRAESIAHAVAKSVPAVWDRFLAGGALSPGEMDALREAFAHEVDEFGLVKLKVYDLSARTIFTSDGQGLGAIESGPALKRAVENRRPSLAVGQDPGEETTYELYVPIFGGGQTLRAVVELYEDVGYLDAVMVRAVAAPVAAPAVLLGLLALVLGRLVARAQADIDARTGALVSLRQKLETFVSAGAVAAAREAGGRGRIPSRRVRCTLFHSDVRGFMSFSEANAPEAVVAYLNRVMALQVRIVREHGGDVDKLIGDALLARFDGADAPARAVAAAQAALARVRAENMTPGIGVGVFTGEAILGAVGPEERQDFTVIGDAVNVAARLCSAAIEGELVVDSETAGRAEGSFGPEETLQIKGRAQPLAVRRATL
ncbi:MAG: adenylate/guanylate cyclase domain-containing protein [Alphaproteobacteria bacterium]|nr:adenylate/guanylate cyclase domain-containing protein [Alphaproteobacteria bacterium]